MLRQPLDASQHYVQGRTFRDRTEKKQLLYSVGYSWFKFGTVTLYRI